MRSWLLTIGAVTLLLLPFAAGAADYGASSTGSGGLPPVAQPLVREGDFAIRLADQLNLGTPADEATAEDMLARAGVAPLNGWLSDYPMTPQIIGQLQESVASAASEGKLPMTADEAVQGLFSLAAAYELPTTPDVRQPAAPDTWAQTAPVQQASPAVINNYYGTYGPPVVTYYTPPPDYLYLYAWVPYPYWWFGFWYPGFYICHSFTTVVTVQPGVTTVVTNRFIDRNSRRAVAVDPNGTRATRNGGTRPDSVLRTTHGDRFRSIADMRRDVPIARPPADIKVRGERDHVVGRSGFEGARSGNESLRTGRMTGAGPGGHRSDNLTRIPENRMPVPGPGSGAINRQHIERHRGGAVSPRVYNIQPSRGGPDPERRPSVSVRPSGGYGGYEGRSVQTMPGNQFRPNSGSGQSGSQVRPYILNSGSGQSGSSQVRPYIGERGSGRDARGGGSFSGGACRGVRC